jgi:hypothetical protein
LILKFWPFTIRKKAKNNASEWGTFAALVILRNPASGSSRNYSHSDKIFDPGMKMSDLQ